MVPTFRAGGPDPPGVNPSLQGRIRDAELLGRRSHGQERHPTPFWSKSPRIVSPWSTLGSVASRKLHESNALVRSVSIDLLAPAVNAARLERPRLSSIEPI